MAVWSNRGTFDHNDSFANSGNVEGISSWGQQSFGGVPNTLNINRNWSSTEEPGNKGRPLTISKKMHPTPL